MGEGRSVAAEGDGLDPGRAIGVTSAGDPVGSGPGLWGGVAEGGTWGHGIHAIGLREPRGTSRAVHGVIRLKATGREARHRNLETADRVKTVGAGACDQVTPDW